MSRTTIASSSITSLSAALRVPKLDPLNYSLWEARFRVFLAAQECLDGIEKPPFQEQRMTTLNAIGDEDFDVLLNQTLILSELPVTPKSNVGSSFTSVPDN